jgi:hypothetical protein
MPEQVKRPNPLRRRRRKKKNMMIMVMISAGCKDVKFNLTVSRPFHLDLWWTQ